MQKIQTRSLGFTLVEVLVISPIIILFIGTFIALLVNLTGESLVLRERNLSTYDTQYALDQIQASISQAITFPAATGTLPTLQGKDNVTGQQFDTAVNSGQSDVLIVDAAATNKGPNDGSRSLIYTGAGACDSRNPIYTYSTIYFIDLDEDTAGNTTDKALYKRTVLPKDVPACESAWQRGSCKFSVRTSNPTSTVCQTSDEKLVGAISKFDVVYYSSGSIVTPADATEISVNIEVEKQVAGDTTTTSGSIRIKGQNIQNSADSSQPTTPPSNPAIEVSRNPAGSNPYQTTYTWGRIGNANSYEFRYRLDSGSWQSVTVNQPGDVNTKPSFVVDAVYRKRVVNAEVNVVSNSGTYSYGAAPAASTIQNWNPCSYVSGSPQWTDYGGTFASASYTRTKTGLVGLKGLVRSGLIGNTICNLPAEFRPAKRLIFAVSSNVGSGNGNGSGRIDILPNGNVIPISGTNGWISLDGIIFSPQTFVSPATALNWSAGTWSGTWTNYDDTYPSDGYQRLRRATDSRGRVHVEGLGKYTGTAPLYSMISTTPTTAQRPPYPTLLTARSGTQSSVTIETGGNIITRGRADSYLQLQSIYYPAGFNSWVPLSYAPNWQRYDLGWSPLECYKDPEDEIVMIRGMIKRPAGFVYNTVAGTIPASCGTYTGQMLLNATTAGDASGDLVARVDINNGSLVAVDYSNVWLSVDGIHYIAD